MLHTCEPRADVSARYGCARDACAAPWAAQTRARCAHGAVLRSARRKTLVSERDSGRPGAQRTRLQRPLRGARDGHARLGDAQRSQRRAAAVYARRANKLRRRWNRSAAAAGSAACAAGIGHRQRRLRVQHCARAQALGWHRAKLRAS